MSWSECFFVGDIWGVQRLLDPVEVVYKCMCVWTCIYMCENVCVRVYVCVVSARKLREGYGKNLNSVQWNP